MKSDFYKILDYYIPNPKCELDYNRDYELLIATVLSAQCTDKRVNMVTKELFNKYDIFSLKDSNINDVIDIIRPCGSHNKKSKYIIDIAKNLVNDYNGIVPNNRKYLESLPGVGRKTCNVVLKNLYDEPGIPVDTHVSRVCKRLGIAKMKDDPIDIEKKLMKNIPKNKWNRVSEQILLFGRYKCKAVNPECGDCLFKKTCNYVK